MAELRAPGSPGTTSRVSQTQVAVGNTGNRAVSHSSSPPSASVRNQASMTVVGQPGAPGQTIQTQATPGMTAVGNQARPILYSSPQTPQPGGGIPAQQQGPAGQIPRPDMATVMGLTDQLRSGALDPQSYVAQLRDYLTNYRNQVGEAIGGVRSEVGERVEGARQRAAQTRQGAFRGALGALGQARTTVTDAASRAGYSGDQIDLFTAPISAAEQWIIDRESSGDPNAWNPTPTDTGHAFGLGQLTDLNRQTYAARLGIDPNTTNPAEQLAMMRLYIQDRYGSPEAAMEFWKRNGWY